MVSEFSHVHGAILGLGLGQTQMNAVGPDRLGFRDLDAVALSLYY